MHARKIRDFPGCRAFALSLSIYTDLTMQTYPVCIFSIGTAHCLRTLYHEAKLHDRYLHSLRSAVFIISYPCNVRTRHPLLQPFCCFALLSQTHSLYSILSAFHPPLTLCKASYQVLSLLNDLFCFLFVC